MSAPLVGNGRAVDCSIPNTWAGVRPGRCDQTSPATAATSGELKLVPTVMLKLSLQRELTGPWLPASVAARIGYRQGWPEKTLTQLPPGAAIAISGPRSLNPTLVPAWRSAATPTTPLQLAGAPTGPPSLLPAAATIITPRAVISSTAAW